MTGLEWTGVISIARDTLIMPLIEGILIYIFGGMNFPPRSILYWAVSITGRILSALLIAVLNPEVLNHRHKGMIRKDAKKWDKYCVGFMSPLALMIAPSAALEYYFQPNAEPLLDSSIFLIFASLMIIGGYIFTAWAQVVNTHFEPCVRIQKERNHKVITSGPYSIVRHPGYAGGILVLPCLPFLLGSRWALLPSFCLIAILWLRTAWEDATLRIELPGYRDYTKKVHDRLIPGFW